MFAQVFWIPHVFLGTGWRYTSTNYSVVSVRSYLRGLNAHCICLFSHVAFLLTVSVWYTSFVNESTTIQGDGSLSQSENLCDTTHGKSAQHCSFEFFCSKISPQWDSIYYAAFKNFLTTMGKNWADNGKNWYNNKTLPVASPNMQNSPKTHRLIRTMRLLNLIEGIEPQWEREYFLYLVK